MLTLDYARSSEGEKKKEIVVMDHNCYAFLVLMMLIEAVCDKTKNLEL